MTRLFWLLLAAPFAWSQPAAVHDLVLTSAGSTLTLDWSPVRHTPGGAPLDGIDYYIHRGAQPWFTPGPATLADSTGASRILLPLEGDHGWYRVVAHRRDAVPPDFVAVHQGSFTQGKVGLSEPEHSVQLTHDYWLGRREITNAEYLLALNWALGQGLLTITPTSVLQDGRMLLTIGGPRNQYEIRYDSLAVTFTLNMGTWNGGSFAGGPGFAYPQGYAPALHPVKWVSWYGAACYCDWRSAMEGLEPYYQGQWDQIPNGRDPYLAEGYRLPTEAEWEHAARWPDGRSFPWGNEALACDLANHWPCLGWSSIADSLEAGASRLGLLDMGGNVVEWCNDWLGDYDAAPVVDPAGRESGDERVLRGGGWASYPATVDAAYRSGLNPSFTIRSNGFRICRLR